MGCLFSQNQIYLLLQGRLDAICLFSGWNCRASQLRHETLLNRVSTRVWARINHPTNCWLCPELELTQASRVLGLTRNAWLISSELNFELGHYSNELVWECLNLTRIDSFIVISEWDPTGTPNKLLCFYYFAAIKTSTNENVCHYIENCSNIS
jgi:hypothetical protein